MHLPRYLAPAALVLTTFVIAAASRGVELSIRF